MKRYLMLAAAALFMFSAVPASAQFWGMPGSTGIIDESSVNLYEFSGGTLRFKGSQTGTIVARYPIGSSSMMNPGYNYLYESHAGAGVTVKLYQTILCGGSNAAELIATIGPSDGSTCNFLDVSHIAWDHQTYSYFIEVTLDRPTTATFPAIYHVQLQQ
jgi:hypothetical protein